MVTAAANNLKLYGGLNLIEVSSILAHVTVMEGVIGLAGYPETHLNRGCVISNMWFPKSPWQFSPFSQSEWRKNTHKRGFWQVSWTKTNNGAHFVPLTSTQSHGISQGGLVK